MYQFMKFSFSLCVKLTNAFNLLYVCVIHVVKMPVLYLLKLIWHPENTEHTILFI